MRQNRKLNSEEAQVEIPARGAGTAHQRRPSGTMAPVWNKRRLPHHLPVVHDRGSRPHDTVSCRCYSTAWIRGSCCQSGRLRGYAEMTAAPRPSRNIGDVRRFSSDW